MMKNVKVLHIHTLPIISGSGINTLITMRGLKKMGYSVEFASMPQGELVNEAIKSGIVFRPIKYMRRQINPFLDMLAFFELISLIRKERYEIVHTHNSKAGFLGRMAAEVCGVPIIIHTIHGFSFHEREMRLRRLLFVFLERLAARFSDKLIAVSTPLMNWGIASKVGGRWQYCVIPDGIEIEKFNIRPDKRELRQEFGFSQQDLIVGAVAKLWSGKGHATILEAMSLVIKEVPNAKFLFVGEGPLLENLKKSVAKKKLGPYVVFAGFRKDIPEITSIFDVAVLVSFFEGLGRVLLEAMVMGKPVVASRVGGIPEIVKNGVNGFLVPAGDTFLLARALIKLLKDGSLRDAMGKAGRKMIDQRFSAKKMIEDIGRIYQELLNEKGIKT